MATDALTIQPIDETNLDAVVALTVAPGQARFIKNRREYAHF
ncbi:hypothetical protein [Exiguobacterium sp. s142]|nr:hypothetical protein [Exiguobacterium sp. s142]